MKQGRIRSFTLFEIVLAMMLAGIVVGMAYTAFTLFIRIYGTYHERNIAHADVQIFRKMIGEDITEASLVVLSDSQISFNGVSDSLGLRYQIQGDYLIRKRGNVQDTFRMKNLVLRSSFETREVSGGIVDQLVFNFEFEGSPMRISITKSYTAEDLFNYTDTLWNQ